MQTGIQTSPNQLVNVPLDQPVMTAPASGQPNMAAPTPGQPIMATPAPGQPIMYQMAPGQQPVFVQVPAGQPYTSPQGQGVQYYVPAGGQSFQQPQMGQPVQGQGASVHGQPPHQDPDMAPIRINKAYMKSALGVSRVNEFIDLFVAGACIVVYSNRTLSLDGRGNFFRGVTIFCWVMVIMYHITYMFGLNKSKNCFGQPSNFTIISMGFQILLTILMISCCASLTVRAKDFSIWFKDDLYTSEYYREITNRNRVNAWLVYIALAFGYLTCLFFLDDIRLLVIMFLQERAQEAGGGTVQLAQQPGTDKQQQFGVVAQPQAGDQQQQFGVVAQPQVGNQQQQFGEVAQPQAVNQQQQFGVVAQPLVSPQAAEQEKA